MKTLLTKTAITPAFSNAHARAGVVRDRISLMNVGRVCSDAIAHELNVAALRRLNNAWFTCDAGGGSSLQNRGGSRQQKVNGKQTAFCRQVAQSTMAAIAKAARIAPCNQPPFPPALVNPNTTKNHANLCESATHINLILGDVAVHDAQQDARSPLPRPRAHVHACRRGHQPEAYRRRKANRSALQLSWQK